MSTTEQCIPSVDAPGNHKAKSVGELMFDILRPGANLASIAPAMPRQKRFKLYLSGCKGFCNPILWKSVTYFFSASGRAYTSLVNKARHPQGIHNHWKKSNVK